MTPEVTIIMPCFNAAPFLRGAVASVLEQTMPEFELLMLDDGSTDATFGLMQELAARDRRLRPVGLPHRGLTPTLNQGLRLAGTRWIARLDPDDLWRPDKLRAQMELVGRFPATILAGTGFEEIDGEGRKIAVHGCPESHAGIVSRLASLGSAFPHSSVLFRRETALAAGGYNERFRKAQDTDLWLRLSGCGEVRALTAPLACIRKHEASLTFEKQGCPQRVYALAAMIGHRRRQAGLADLSQAPEPVWLDFLTRLERIHARIEPAGPQTFLARLRAAWWPSEPAPAWKRGGRLACLAAASPTAFLQALFQKVNYPRWPSRLFRWSTARWPR